MNCAFLEWQSKPENTHVLDNGFVPDLIQYLAECCCWNITASATDAKGDMRVSITLKV